MGEGGRGETQKQSFQPSRKFPQGLTSLTIPLSANGRHNSQNEVFEITENEASGRGRQRREATRGEVSPTELQPPQQSPCREVGAAGPRLA